MICERSVVADVGHGSLCMFGAVTLSPSSPAFAWTPLLHTIPPVVGRLAGNPPRACPLVLKRDILSACNLSSSSSSSSSPSPSSSPPKKDHSEGNWWQPQLFVLRCSTYG